MSLMEQVRALWDALGAEEYYRMAVEDRWETNCNYNGREGQVIVVETVRS